MAAAVAAPPQVQPTQGALREAFDDVLVKHRRELDRMLSQWAERFAEWAVEQDRHIAAALHVHFPGTANGENASTGGATAGVGGAGGAPLARLSPRPPHTVAPSLSPLPPPVLPMISQASVGMDMGRIASDLSYRVRQSGSLRTQANDQVGPRQPKARVTARPRSFDDESSVGGDVSRVGSRVGSRKTGLESAFSALSVVDFRHTVRETVTNMVSRVIPWLRSPKGVHLYPGMGSRAPSAAVVAAGSIEVGHGEEEDRASAAHRRMSAGQQLSTEDLGINRLKKEIRASAAINTDHDELSHEEDSDSGDEAVSLHPSAALGVYGRRRRGLLQRLLRHPGFEMVAGILIVANAVVVALSLSRRSTGNDGLDTLLAIEAGLYLCQIIEVLLRLLVWQGRFFTGRGFRWHFFDVLLLLASAPARYWHLLGDTARSSRNVSFLRVIRLLSFSKVGLVLGIAKRFGPFWFLLETLSATFWSSLPPLLFAFGSLYVCGMLILVMVQEHLQYEDDAMTNIAVRESLLANWSTLYDVTHSSLACFYGGADWDEKASSLKEVSSACYGVFLVQLIFLATVVVNLLSSSFRRVTLITLESIDNFKQQVIRRRQWQYVDKVEQILGCKTMDYPDFYMHLNDDMKLVRFITGTLRMSVHDAEYLFYTLAASGTEEVDIETFVLGCIEMRTQVAKIDIMRLKSNFDAALEEHAEQQNMTNHQLSLSSRGFLSGMASIAVTELQIQKVTADQILRYLEALFCRVAHPQEQKEFRSTALALISLVRQAQGGCGFCLTTPKGYGSLRGRKIDFQVVDRDARFPDGYMTARLRGKHIAEEGFVAAVRDFTNHHAADQDRWPRGHEAAGLPMDGYITLSSAGFSLKAAVRVGGLPTPPLKWDNVGTRHMAGLALTWVLRLYPALVIVRSDSGSIHFLYMQGIQVMCLKLVDELSQSDLSPSKNGFRTQAETRLMQLRNRLSSPSSAFYGGSQESKAGSSHGDEDAFGALKSEQVDMPVDYPPPRKHTTVSSAPSSMTVADHAGHLKRRAVSTRSSLSVAAVAQDDGSPDEDSSQAGVSWPVISASRGGRFPL